MSSKKATKFDEIFNANLTLCSKCQIDSVDFFNFCGLLRKHELYKKNDSWPRVLQTLNFLFHVHITVTKFPSNAQNVEQRMTSKYSL